MAALAKKIPTRPPPVESSKTFEEAFAKKTHSAGPESGTDCQLFAARSSAGDEQATHVETCDQQNTSGRSENGQQWSAVVGNSVVQQTVPHHGIADGWPGMSGLDLRLHGGEPVID